MPKPISPELVYDLTTLSAPTLSPDGSRVVFAQSKVDRDSMENRSQLMSLARSEGKATPFLDGDKDGNPSFSPDGESVAFVREDKKGKRNLWVAPSAGGEAKQVTSVSGGITEYAWSPDSSAIAFVSDVDPNLLPDDHDAKKDPHVKIVTRVRYRADSIGWRGDAFRHVFVADLQGGEARQLTDGKGEDSTPVWSPDGSKIAFISDAGDDRDFSDKNNLYVVPASGGDLKVVSQGLHSVSSHTWSPDGSRIAVVGSDDPQAPAGRYGLIYLLEEGKPPRQITDDSVMPNTGYAPTTPPPEMRWTQDNRVLFIGEERGQSFLYDVSIEDGELRRVAGGSVQYGTVTFDADAQKAVVTAIPPSSSGDLRLIDIAESSVSLIADANQEYFVEHPAAKLEKFSFQRAGHEIEARVFLPPDFDPSQKYPMVLDIHGGPHGVFYDAFNPTQQVMATNGYIVLAVNPRGSSTYGIEFMKAVLADWGGEDFRDIMAAVDEMSSRPYVDASRLGITGYSYGGYMSSWIIGHETRFKAAVVGAPCINLSSMYGTSDIGVRFGENQWGGSRMNALEVFLERSPLTYAPNVVTPVLLMHGEADVRCPIEQSEQYFVTLKRLGKEVEFVRFPDSAHLFLRAGHPRLREEYLARLLGWFDKRLKVGAGSAAQPQAAPADND